jgi:hypothetical protein
MGVGRRGIPSDLIRNIELLVGVALPLFLAGVWLQDHLTGTGHWAHPLESAFFEWLALVPLLAFIGLVHSVGMAMVVALWPRTANRGTVALGAVVLVPLLVLAGRPLGLLAQYAVPLALALGVYVVTSHIPGGRAPPEEDLRTAPVSEGELLGHDESQVMATLEVPPAEPAPSPAPGPARQVR